MTGNRVYADVEQANVPLTCTIKGPTTAPTITWKISSNDLSGDSRYTVGDVSHSGDEATSVLIVKQAPVSHHTYTCSASGTEFSLDDLSITVDLSVIGNYS